MKILVIGNLSSGKSTICRILQSQLPLYEYISIDSIRELHGDGSQDAEDLCKSIFLDSINNSIYQIIEISGIGQLGIKTLERTKPSKNVLIIYPRCSREIIDSRNASRSWNIPFPHGPENIPVAVSHTSEEFKSGLLERLLEICPEAMLYSFANHSRSSLDQSIKIILDIVKAKIRDEK